VSTGACPRAGSLPAVVNHRLKRVMHGAVVVTAATAVASLSPGSATADPPPASAADPQQRFQELSSQADQIGQQYLAAKDALAARRDDLARATADIQKDDQDLRAAQADEEKFRGQVDQLAAASYGGAQFTQLSALLTGESAKDFLDQSTALQMVASRNLAVLNTYDAAVSKAADAKAKATDAQKRASDAADAAAEILADLDHKKQDAEKAVAEARAALGRLSAAQRHALLDVGDLGSFIGPPGAAGVAMQAALAQRGVPYVWGGETPGGGFDCSGLTQWAYRQAGVNIPRSAAAQYGIGQLVSRDALRPGDLIFFGRTASGIYHVAMYVGNGMVVHAPTEGENVKVVPLSQAGGGYFGAKRVVG